MVRTAAPEIRLGDETANLAAKLLMNLIEFSQIGRQIKRLPPAFQRTAFVSRKTDKPHARVAFRILLAAGHGAGQSLLAVEPMARGKNHLPRRVLCERHPQRLDDPFAAA